MKRTFEFKAGVDQMKATLETESPHGPYISFTGTGPRGGFVYGPGTLDRDAMKGIGAMIAEALEWPARPAAPAGDGPDIGDHAHGYELEPESGYILLSPTDGEADEMNAALDSFPAAQLIDAMCCQVADVAGVIVKRHGKGMPPLEIWATTHPEPENTSDAEFCLVWRRPDAAAVPFVSVHPCEGQPGEFIVRLHGEGRRPYTLDVAGAEDAVSTANAVAGTLNCEVRTSLEPVADR
jgi:hypothetical protein